jgi:ethanolamine ammonia-lyase small subunit
MRIMTIHTLAVREGLMLDLESTRNLVLVAGQAKENRGLIQRIRKIAAVRIMTDRAGPSRHRTMNVVLVEFANLVLVTSVAGIGVGMRTWPGNREVFVH